MNADRELIYSYSHLFIVTLFFSALASGIFLLYLLVRENSWILFEPYIVGALLCVSFSALGQRLSKVNKIRRWIFFVSALSSVLNYEIFVSPEPISHLWYVPLVYGGSIFVWGWYMLWEVLDVSWTYVTQREITKKPIVISIGVSISVILVIFFSYIYSITITSFFDTHPWAMTLIGVLITLIGGIFVGRKTKK